MPIIDEATINKIQLIEQGSNPSTPASGKAYLFVRDDGEPYLRNDGGSVLPLVLNLVSGTSSILTGLKTLVVERGLVIGVTGSFAYIKGSGGLGARVFRTTNQSILGGVATVLEFNAESYDFGDFHSVVSNTSRLTAPVSGFYSISGGFRWADNATGIRGIIIFLNGSISLLVEYAADAANSSPKSNHASLEWFMNAGDYVELQAYQDITGAGALNVLSAGIFSPFFSITKVG